MVENTDVMKLSNELTYQRYLFNREHIKDIFMKMSIPEYIALHHIAMEEEMADIYSGRTYLKDLSDKLQMTMRQTSKMIERLRDKGYVLWSHDGNGSEGTYVTITESGRNLLQEQEEAMKRYYGKVFDKFGKDNLIQLLQLMKQLETVMSSEIESLEVEADEYGTDEYGADE
ncbi:MAG: MarR family winged helix-turn-helix transcriptional regulator [Lachnospiraceae bacterium]